MSALEIIEQIKALPPQEKAQVVDFVREMEADTAQKLGVRYMDKATFKDAKGKVFSKHSELLSKLAK